jgi:hypothetical protein
MSHYARVCAWCGREWDGHAWVFTEWKPRHRDTKITHGMCEDCQLRMRQEAIDVHATA